MNHKKKTRRTQLNKSERVLTTRTTYELHRLYAIIFNVCNKCTNQLLGEEMKKL